MTIPVIALDIETTGLDPHKDKILSYAWSVDGMNYSGSKGVTGLKELILAPETLFVLHNAKFDMHFLHKVGIDIPIDQVRDTMLLHHLLDENKSHGLGSIVLEQYQDNYKEEFWSKYKKFEEAPSNEADEYNGKDVLYTWKLYHDISNKLRDCGVTSELVVHVHRLAAALYKTEIRGLRVDKEYLIEKGIDIKQQINELLPAMRLSAREEIELTELLTWQRELDKRKTAKGKAGVERPSFSFDSSKQVMELLYDQLSLPEQKHPKTRNPTVDDGALEALMGQHPIIPLLRRYRDSNKIYTAYIEGTLDRLHNGRIYPTFNINGTVTGRISSSNPNMQQLPREGGIRGMYVADPGHKLLSCDYSQLEVVIAAHFSQDPNLLKIVLEGASKHDITADALGIERHHAKTLNFAMQYQCSPRKVAQILSCSLQEAQVIWDKYWRTYAKEKEVIDWCKKHVDSGTPIRNVFGRLRHFPTSFEKSWHKEAAYRQAYSSLIQGTGADCTHWAVYTTATRLEQMGLGRLLFEVHDEILIEAPFGKTEAARKVLEDTMIEAGVYAKLTVPLTVDCSDPLDRWEK